MLAWCWPSKVWSLSLTFLAKSMFLRCLWMAHGTGLHRCVHCGVLAQSRFRAAPIAYFCRLCREGQGAFSTECWVFSSGVIEAVYVFKDCQFSGPSCRPMVPPTQLGFDGFEECLNSGIVTARQSQPSCVQMQRMSIAWQCIGTANVTRRARPLLVRSGCAEVAIQQVRRDIEVVVAVGLASVNLIHWIQFLTLLTLYFFDLSTRMSFSRINRQMRRWPTSSPASFNTSVIRGLP